MDITTLENWLWEAACSVRGPLDAPKYNSDEALDVVRMHRRVKYQAPGDG